MPERVCASSGDLPGQHDFRGTQHHGPDDRAAVAIAQIFKFNTVKHKCMQSTSSSSTVRHIHAQETPLPIYVGMMLYTHTVKKELVDRLLQFHDLRQAGVTEAYMEAPSVH